MSDEYRYGRIGYLAHVVSWDFSEKYRRYLWLVGEEARITGYCYTKDFGYGYEFDGKPGVFYHEDYVFLGREFAENFANAMTERADFKRPYIKRWNLERVGN